MCKFGLLTQINVQRHRHRDINVRFQVQLVHVLRAARMYDRQLANQFANILANLRSRLTVSAHLHVLRNAAVDVLVEHFAQRRLNLIGQLLGTEIHRYR